ncbi:hypothetical protein D3C76_1502290 [compost metagenome]
MLYLDRKSCAAVGHYNTLHLSVHLTLGKHQQNIALLVLVPRVVDEQDLSNS